MAKPKLNPLSPWIVPLQTLDAWHLAYAKRNMEACNTFARSLARELEIRNAPLTLVGFAHRLESKCTDEPPSPERVEVMTDAAFHIRTFLITEATKGPFDA